MRAQVLMVLLVCGFAPMAHGQEITDGSGADIESDVLDSMYLAMNAELRDGYSARYSRLEVKGTTICGFVNAKNAFGAYVGESAFMFRTRDESVSILPEIGDVLYPIVEISFNSVGCDKGRQTPTFPRETPTPEDWQDPIDGLGIFATQP